MTADAVSGVLTYAVTLASELARTGTKTHLALMGPEPRPEQLAAARAIPGLVIHESTHALEWMHEPWADLARAVDWLRDLEKRVRPDIVHLNGAAHGAAGFTAPVLVVAHSCLLSWWEAVEGTSVPERYATYREAVKRGLRAADAVIVASGTMRASLARHYGPLPRTAVVPNGLAVAAAPGRERERLVLAAGRAWDRGKNLEILARAAGKLPWPVKIAGASAAPGVAADRTESRAFARDNVELLGWLPQGELWAWMDRAAIFAAPAKYEPFGLAVLEAALRGAALVLGDIASSRELWSDAAVFVRPDDEAGLIDAVSRLAADDARRAELAAAANLRAQLFTPARNARAMRELYDAILRGRRIPTSILQGRESRTAGA
ncbi:MAG: glycosyltransferase family 4 protein [Labilithrix sp.]|nr:glycosyltransferase family 4 protein [Labilithrix sp.]MCW5834439.1 glycosyltransferase family 4 protein [Labilithrix sp.]